LLIRLENVEDENEVLKQMLKRRSEGGARDTL